MLTLGLETSCDETSASVTDGNKVLSNIVSSSVHLHKKYGGVVPEIASRFHVEYIAEVLTRSLEDSRKSLKDIKLVAVTNGPGLVGALLTWAFCFGSWFRSECCQQVNYHLYSIYK